MKKARILEVNQMVIDLIDQNTDLHHGICSRLHKLWYYKEKITREESGDMYWIYKDFKIQNMNLVSEDNAFWFKNNTLRVIFLHEFEKHILTLPDHE